MGQLCNGAIVEEHTASGALRERREAQAVQRVLDRNSREVVGWLYRWNTGHVAVMWKGGRCEDVTFEQT